MKQTIRYLTVLGLVTLGPAAAEARWQIDFSSGVFIPTHLVEVSEDSKFGAPGVSFALGGGYGLGERVNLTGQVQTNSSGFFGSSLQASSVTGGARFFLLPPQRFRPWLGSEIGWYLIETEDSGSSLFGGSRPSVSQSDDSFGLNVGTGLDIFVHRRVSVGADVRYHNAFSALDGVDFVTAMLNVGIHFGLPPSPPPAPVDVTEQGS